MNRVGDSLQHFGGNEPLVRALIEHRVEFILVGGIAIAWHCPERKADDLDVLVNPTEENHLRIASVLSAVGVSEVPVKAFAKPGVHLQLKKMHYADLLTPQVGAPGYAQMRESAVQARIFNIPVLVASIGTLLTLKQLAVEAAEHELSKHRKDIEYLSHCAA